MTFHIYRDLAKWLYARFQEGQPRELVEQMLREQDYTEGQIAELCELTYHNTEQLKNRIDAYEYESEKATIQRRQLPFEVCAPIHHEDRNYIDADHGRIKISFKAKRPYVMVLDNFLTDEECDALIELGTPNRSRALVIDRKTGGDQIDERRTSTNVILDVYQNALIRRIEDRISEMTHIPVENGESIQIMHYDIGAEYAPHHDHFADDIPGEVYHHKHGGNRVATLVMYLNDCEEGGSTIFPHAGIEVFPQKGSAVYFAYLDDDNVPDDMSFHGGSPVIRGEKWIASKWIRRYPTPWGLNGVRSAPPKSEI